MEIVFNKQGYDPFIDFLKAYSILVIVIAHGMQDPNKYLYPIWGCAVPLFIIIQVYHVYKREPKAVDIRRLLSRILLPFVITHILIAFVLSYRHHGISSLTDYGNLANDFWFRIRYGQGSYYPWVYLQLAFVIPLVRPLMEKCPRKVLFLVFVVISMAIEMVCSQINLPDRYYRLVFLRYFFLLYIGWIWAKEGIMIKTSTICASIIGLGSIVYFAYFETDLSSFFYNTSWTTHRWPCYFWCSWLFACLLYCIYNKIIHVHRVKRIVAMIASSSYEIFLAQMFLYAVTSPNDLRFIDDVQLQYRTWIILVLTLSVCMGWTFNYSKKYLLYANNKK